MNLLTQLSRSSKRKCIACRYPDCTRISALTCICTQSIRNNFQHTPNTKECQEPSHGNSTPPRDKNVIPDPHCHHPHTYHSLVKPYPLGSNTAFVRYNRFSCEDCGCKLPSSVIIWNNLDYSKIGVLYCQNHMRTLPCRRYEQLRLTDSKFRLDQQAGLLSYIQ